VSSEAVIPDASDLGEGIAQIRLPMAGNPLRYINGYVLDDEGGLTLVDCGWKADDVFAALTAGLHALGHELSDVRRVVITHHHFDHYGLAGTLRRAGVPELLMHALDWERAQSFASSRIEIDRAADAWLARNGFTPDGIDDEGFDGRWEVIEPTRLIGDGERVGRLEAIWTPGHSPGHLCFADTRSGRMLTGDHVLDPITPHVGMWRGREGDPLSDYLASLEKIRGRGAAGALPAHGEPFPDLERRIDELVAHTAQRDGQVVAALESGAASAGEIALRLPWTRRNRSFNDLGQWHQQFAVSETIAHLHHLRACGRVVLESGPDPIRYRALSVPEEEPNRRLNRAV
jgi:glyoxylase-like metal-dependent hydrolase (beta-lactamase superfamily II)